MTERAYTVAEIDRMRRAVRTIHRLSGNEREELLRTYIIAGMAPEELEATAARVGPQTYRITGRFLSSPTGQARVRYEGRVTEISDYLPAPGSFDVHLCWRGDDHGELSFLGALAEDVVVKLVEMEP